MQKKTSKFGKLRGCNLGRSFIQCVAFLGAVSLTSYSVSGLYTSLIYKNMTTPVYTTLKGVTALLFKGHV